MVKPSHSISRQRYMQVVSLGSAVRIAPQRRDHAAVAVSS